MRYWAFSILILASSAYAETFGVTTIGGSSGAMPEYNNNYTWKSFYYTEYQYIASGNDYLTEIWLYGDSLNAPCSLFAGFYTISYVSGDSANPDLKLQVCDTIGIVPNGYRWLRLNAVTDYQLSVNDTATLVWSQDTTMMSYYDVATRATVQESAADDALPADLPLSTFYYLNYEYSVFGCANQEGNAAINQGHVPTSYSGGTNWTTPENIQGDEGLIDLDDACAEYDHAGTDILAATGFDHSLPTSPAPTVDSITIVVQGNCEATNATNEDFDISLSKDGSTAIQWWETKFVNTSITCGGLEDNLTYTFRGDTLGTWSGAEINSSLYVLLKDGDGKASGLRFDGLTTTVYFTPGIEAEEGGYTGQAVIIGGD